MGWALGPIPLGEWRLIVKSEQFEGQCHKGFSFGPNVRRELVLADLMREALQESPGEARTEDLSLLQVARTMGPLEAEVMEVVWQKEEASVRDVYQVFARKREIAYTTVLTVLRNLNRKGLLRRRRNTNGYLYTPSVSRQDFVESRVGEIMDLLLDRFPGPTLSHLLRRMERERG